MVSSAATVSAAEAGRDHPQHGAAHLRLSSVDHLRGLVMVLMVLDHTREFFMNYPRFEPTDLATTTPLLFLTRWVTHFCAPVFVFLAGTGAFLMHAHGKSKPEVSRFLFTRGLWLIFLEFTIIRAAWMFKVDASLFLLQVIWAIGVSMVVLSGLIYLPVPAIVAVGLAIVAGHNLFDLPALSAWLGKHAWAARFVRPGGFQPIKGTTVIVAYPPLPWLGVMALGYAFGPVLQWPHHRRRRAIFAIGAVTTIAFVALRAWNVYGNPSPWSRQATWPMTVVSFLNCDKYPPSLLYVLMTLGPALMLLAWFDGGTGAIGRRLVTFGRVPLFFYFLQWLLVRSLAVGLALKQGEPVAWLFQTAPFDPPAWYGHSLGTVYLAWAVAVLLLYPPCRWFAEVKRRRRDWWLSYL
jgi:uncharacterized membrane protein